jgi:hypothetical protein
MGLPSIESSNMVCPFEWGESADAATDQTAVPETSGGRADDGARRAWYLLGARAPGRLALGMAAFGGLLVLLARLPSRRPWPMIRRLTIGVALVAGEALIPAQRHGPTCDALSCELTQRASASAIAPADDCQQARSGDSSANEGKRSLRPVARSDDARVADSAQGFPSSLASGASRLAGCRLHAFNKGGRGTRRSIGPRPQRSQVRPTSGRGRGGSRAGLPYRTGAPPPRSHRRSALPTTASARLGCHRSAAADVRWCGCQPG